MCSLFVARIMKMTSVIMSGPIFFQLSGHAVFMAVNLFQINEVKQFWKIYQELKQNFIFLYVFIEQMLKDPGFTVSVPLNSMLTQIIYIYFFCRYADNATHRSLKVTDIVYTSNWYQFPIEYQRFIQIWIQRSQKTYIFDGLGLFACSLPTFMAVSY